MPVHHPGEAMARLRPAHPLRTHQRDALERLARSLAHGDARRAWGVLPPGLGKTLTGLEAARRIGDPAVVFGPAKTEAVREILAAEDGALGERLRAVVVCDHERATATLPARLGGVLDEQAVRPVWCWTSWPPTPVRPPCPRCW